MKKECKTILKVKLLHDYKNDISIRILFHDIDWGEVIYTFFETFYSKDNLKKLINKYRKINLSKTETQISWIVKNYIYKSNNEQLLIDFFKRQTPFLRKGLNMNYSELLLKFSTKFYLYQDESDWTPINLEKSPIQFSLKFKYAEDEYGNKYYKTSDYKRPKDNFNLLFKYMLIFEDNSCRSEKLEFHASSYNNYFDKIDKLYNKAMDEIIFIPHHVLQKELCIEEVKYSYENGILTSEQITQSTSKNELLLNLSHYLKDSRCKEILKEKAEEDPQENPFQTICIEDIIFENKLIQ